MNTHAFYRYFFLMIFLSVWFILTIGNVQARPTQQTETDFAAVDAYVAEQLKNLDIPGLVLGIVEDGQIAHVQGFGVADSSGRAVTPQTPFYIGSVSKSFTALAVMQLVEAGKIDLDLPVQTYLSWFELADKDASAQITVRHLLNQTTGISTKDGNRFWASQQGLEETVRQLDTIQLTQSVGSAFQYSNINFMIAGLIVEKVTGRSYGDYVHENIFEPLDMQHAYASRSPAVADGLAEGHIFMFGQVFRDEGPQPPVYLPAGALIASVEDMTHYMIAQLNDGRYGENRILSPQGTDELHDPAIPMMGDKHYGMGWIVDSVDGVSAVYHNGDAGRNHAVVILMPDSDSGIVLLANASGFEQVQQVDAIGSGIFSMLNGKTAPPVSLPFIIRLQYWATLLVPLLQVLGMVLVWRKRQRMKAGGVLLTAILNLAVVFLLFRLSLTIITIQSLLVFYPELGAGLIAIATLGIGWSVIYTAWYAFGANAPQSVEIAKNWLKTNSYSS
ncbi:MAG: class A beta-lactamase-related serine hydrolase [Chloroflexi bacterium]|nr:MAG: class A beta-lactamase-related serine hydrolase [Chloroflexota bacterium]